MGQTLKLAYNVIFEVFTAMTMKNRVLNAYEMIIDGRLEVFMAVIKKVVFWDVMPCGSCTNRSFGGTWRLLHQGDKNQ
jgi:hypothetical protein